MTLKLVHSNICEPIISYSNGSKRYINTFVNDLNRKIAIYFFQKKYDVFANFKSYKVLIENEIDCSI